MELSRRQTLVLGVGGAALLAFGAAPARAAIDAQIADITGGAATTAGTLVLSAPEIAENGNTVPVEVAAPGAVAVTLLADGNPTPEVAKFTFGKLSSSRSASTRIRLAQTQNVIAIAQMEDGSFQRADATVKVTIGGCGG